MAEMTIQLKIDPVSGKKDIIVSLRGDEDSLPHEHEQQHKALVDQLIEGGLLKATEVGNVIVQRDQEQSAPETIADGRSQDQDERESHAEGN